MTALHHLRIGSMCTGYGGLDMAVGTLFDAEIAWCAENDRHAATILATRLPGTPNLGDLTGVDWRLVPAVDLVTAGFPCQDISVAGRGAGIRKETRSGLWFTIAGALRLLRPPYVFLENVAALRTRGLQTVLGALASMGYDTAWLCLRASDVGAPHRRERLFILAAHPDRFRLDGSREPGSGRRPESPGKNQPLADAGGMQRQRHRTAGVLAGTAGAEGREAGSSAERGGQAPADSASKRHGNGRTARRDGERRQTLRRTALGGLAADTEGERRG